MVPPVIDTAPSTRCSARTATREGSRERSLIRDARRRPRTPTGVANDSRPRTCSRRPRARCFATGIGGPNGRCVTAARAPPASAAVQRSRPSSSGSRSMSATDFVQAPVGVARDRALVQRDPDVVDRRPDGVGPARDVGHVQQLAGRGRHRCSRSRRTPPPRYRRRGRGPVRRRRADSSTTSPRPVSSQGAGVTTSVADGDVPRIGGRCGRSGVDLAGSRPWADASSGLSRTGHLARKESMGARAGNGEVEQVVIPFTAVVRQWPKP